MAVKFLSQEWADALTEKLNADQSFTSSIAGKKAKIQQNVDAPDGQHHYWLTIDGGRIDMGLGEVDGADATISEDYDTAVKLAKSEINVVTAFMSGKIKVTNLGFLMPLQGALSDLPKAMQQVDTEY
ncbi:MAG: SCP2 sterol-binding domain-containing protein [Actinomycetota bacterium]